MTQMEETTRRAADFGVDHEDLMSVRHSRKTRMGRTLTRMVIKFNPYGAGIFISPSGDTPVMAKRDPATKRILDREYTIECYEHEVPAILEWVEPDMAGVEHAAKIADKMLRTFMATQLEPGTEIPENRAEWSQELRNIAMKYSPSPARPAPSAEAMIGLEGQRGDDVSGEATRRFGILPLLSAVVVETGIPAPKDVAAERADAQAKQAAQSTSDLAAAIMALVQQHAGAATPAADEIEKLRKANEGMAAKIKALEAKLSDAKK